MSQMKCNSRNFCMVATIALVGAMAMPSMARKKKVQPITPQPSVVEKDSLAPNDRKRFEYIFTEAARLHAAGKYSEAFDLYEYARSIDPHAAEPYFFESIYYSQMKQDSMAIEFLQKAVSLNPKNLTYTEHLAQYYIGNRQFDKAIEAYESIYAQNHENTDALRILAQLYQQQKNYPMMLRTIERLEVEEGESEQIALAKMRVYELMNDKKAAYRELKTLSDQHPLEISYKTMLGNWLMQNDRQKEAYKLFMEALKEEPDNSYAQISLYDYYNSTHQETLAQEMLDKILMSKKTDTDTKIMMFRSYIQNNESNGGDSTQVLELFDKVLAVPHPTSEIAELRAAYMSLKKMPADSLCAAYQRVLDIAPENASARMQLVQLLWNKKKYQEVIAQTETAHQYNPDEMVFYYFGGMAYYQEQKEDETLSEFRRGLAQVNSKSQPELVSDLYMIMGDILNKKNEQDASFAAYDSCLQWKDDNVPGLNNYAYYLSVIGKDLPKAEAMSYKTIKAEPSNGTYLDTYAWILFMEERYVEAKAYIDQALKYQDTTANNSTVLEHAGDIYAMNGMSDEAVDFWSQSLQSGNDTATLKWKIKNKQYISEDELQRRNAPKKTPQTIQKTIKKGRKR